MCVRRAATARRTSLGGEGNAPYPVLSSSECYANTTDAAGTLRSIRAASSHTSISPTRSSCDVNRCSSHTISSFRVSSWWVSVSWSSFCRPSPARRYRWVSPCFWQWLSTSCWSLKPFRPRPKWFRLSVSHSGRPKAVHTCAIQLQYNCADYCNTTKFLCYFIVVVCTCADRFNNASHSRAIGRLLELWY